MVIRSVVGGPWAMPSLGSCFAGALLMALIAAALPAQLPTEAVSPPQEPQAEAPVYGKIVGEQVRLRCWTGAVATPPMFEDVLAQGQIVQLGRSESGFREVRLPLGPIGYVSKRYANQAEDGTVTSKGSKVAYRYRPRTTEAPVAQLAEGTAILVIGEQDDWYRGRVAGIEAWVAAAEVQVVDAADAEVVAAYQKLTETTRGEAQARLDAIAAELKRKQQAAIDLEAVKVVEQAFAKELLKPVAEQDFAPLTGALDKLTTTLAQDSEALPAVASLHKRIETQQWIAEATVVKNSQPPVDDTPPPTPMPIDRLERFDAIGWLRYERHLAGPGVYYIEKGGRRQHVLSCNTGRYDLALFVGREVGVIGPRRQPTGATMSELDVERLEVLGSIER